MNSKPAGERPQYIAPTITEMDESEVLKTFQITSAAVTWWGM